MAQEAYTRTISVKDITKEGRVLMRITVFSKGILLSTQLCDITEMIGVGTTLLHYGDCMHIIERVFGIDIRSYPVIRPITKNPYPNYFTKEPDGMTLHIKDSDLEKMRDERLRNLGIE